MEAGRTERFSPIKNYKNLRRLVFEHYNLGELISAQRITKGYITVNIR